MELLQYGKGFDELYKVITNWSPEENPTELWIMAKDWVKLFLSMNGKREGYDPLYAHHGTALSNVFRALWVGKDFYRTGGGKE
jgi:hypothetical protein